jgi:hypothetical protein
MGREARHIVGFGKYATKTFFWVYKNDPEHLQQLKQYFPFYTHLKRENIKDLIRKYKNDGLSTLAISSIISEITELYRQGKTLVEIRKEIQEKHPSLKNSDLQKYTSKAKQIIRDEFEEEKKYIVETHILRYNDIYDKNVNRKINTNKEHIRKMLKTEFLSTALDALQAKEKLLGLHTKTFKIEINRFFAQKNDINKKQYDFTLLTFEEKKELKNLLNLAKIKPMFKQLPLSNLEQEVEQFTGKKTSKELELDAPIQEIRDIERQEQSKTKSVDIGNVTDYTDKAVSSNLNSIQDSLQQKVQEKLERFLKKKK